MDKLDDNYPKLLLGRPPASLAELYINKSRWCKGTNGRTAQGDSVDEWNPGAVQWCLSGALALVYGDHQNEAMQKLRQWLIEHRGLEKSEDADDRDYLVNWNDSEARTFPEVRAAIVGAGV